MTALAVVHVGGNGAVYHVHAEGCGDLRREPRYRQREVEAGEWANMEALVRDFYDGHISDSGDDNWQQYVPEFRVFPCAKVFITPAVTS